jgi:hypothetical protein
MKKVILLAALATSVLVSACTVVRERDVETRPAATVIQRY